MDPKRCLVLSRLLAQVRKPWSVALTLIAAGAISATAAAATFEMKISHAANTKHPIHVTLERFKELAEKRSSGRLQVKVFHSGQLAGQREGVEGGLAGSMIVRTEQRTLQLANLTVTVQNSGWDLAPSAAPQTITWDEGGLAVSPLLFVNTASRDQASSSACTASRGVI